LISFNCSYNYVFNLPVFKCIFLVNILITVVFDALKFLHI